jgi:hypothetical protein
MRLLPRSARAGLLALALVSPAGAADLPLAINVGQAANDGTGDTLRTAFSKTMAAVNALYLSRAAANGLATLDGTGRLVTAQLPSTVATLGGDGRLPLALLPTAPTFAALTLSGSGSIGDVSLMSVTPSAGAATGTLARLLADRAPLASPTFTGTATVPTLAITGSGSTGDAGGLSVTATGADTARTNAARAADAVNAKDYSTFAAAAAQAASTGKPLRLPAGSYSYTSGTFLTVTADVIFEPGATLTCNSNNLGFTGNLSAPATQIFASGCTPSFFSSKKQPTAFPEWWGAVGDSSGAAGNGTDSTAAFQAAVSSGLKAVQLGAQRTYRITNTITVSQSNIAFRGVSRDATSIVLDDATGLLDAFKFGGNASSSQGGYTFERINVYRAQGGLGYVNWAYPVTPGSGYLPGDTITLTGGTATTQAVLTVATTQVSSATVASGGSGGTAGTQTVTGTTGTGTKFQAVVTVSGGAITAVQYISVGGAYTANPTTLSAEPVTGAGLTGATLNVSMGVGTLTVATPGSYSAAPTNPVAQGSTSGAGTGATIAATYEGSSLLRFVDAYYATVADASVGGSNAWNAITVASVNQVTNKVYIRRNHIFSARNDGVFVYGNTTNRVGDTFVEDNYIQGAGRAATEFYGRVDGSFVANNALYNNKYGNIADVGAYALGSIGSYKVRHNDIDTNSVMGAYWRGVNSSHFQQNWVATGGPFTCEGCTSIQADGNQYNGANSGIVLKGTQSFVSAGSLFNGNTAPVTVGPTANRASQYISITGAVYTYGNGTFLTFNSATGLTTAGVTVGVQMDNTGATLTTGSVSRLVVIEAPDQSNTNGFPGSKILFGASNTIFADNAGAAGYANNVSNYNGFAIGTSNNVTANYGHARGWYASTDANMGADCFASGSFSTGSGTAQTCQHTLRVASSSTAAVRLTADGGAANTGNCIVLPNNSHTQFEIRVSGRDTASAGNWADWASTSVNVLDRGANAAATTYSGSFTSATAAQASAGTGSTATLQLSADTTNGCLNVSIVPPNSNAWRWVAHVQRVKVQ